MPAQKTTQLVEAILGRDAAKIRELILQLEFTLIKIHNEDDENEDDSSTLTADVDDFDVIVCFTTEASAGSFVESMTELFEDAEDVDGIVVAGDVLLDSLPDDFGLLINPENEQTAVVDPSLLIEVQTAK